MLHPTVTPLDLDHRGTPLRRLARPSARLGVELWVKRDDRTGFGLSGNKVRKLAWLLAEAEAEGATTVLTTGGIQSNHCRATAIAARQLGLRPVLLLRGSPPQPAALDGNLLLDAVLGAEVRWCSDAEYAHRDQLLAEMAAACRAAGERPYVVPEGGSNALGSLGFVEAARELRDQAAAAGVSFDSVWCGVGSGGTLAGLAIGLPDTRVVGVAVCDDRATFRARVQAIAADAAAWGHRLATPGPETWDVRDGHQGRGYALATPSELRTQARFARETGILLDPVYTGKAWCALEHAIAHDPAAVGRRALFWHTGGAFGLFGRGAELAAALGDTPTPPSSTGAA